MADQKISQLTAVTTLDGTEEFVLADSGATKKITADDLANAVGGGGGELFYAEATSDVTVTSSTEATPTDIVSLGAQTYDGTPIILEFFCATVSPASGACSFIVALWDGTTNLCRWIDTRLGNAQEVSVHSMIRLTPSAGSHTYKARGFIVGGAGNQVFSAGSGSGGSATYAPLFIRASRA